MGGWEASTLHRDFQGREPQSWSESLAFYKHSQSSRPLPDEAYAKPQRVTRYEVSRKEAEYNPITQAWRDQGREREARARDLLGTIAAQNRAKDRQLAHERNTHDVLNHSIRRTGLPDPQAQAGLAFPTEKREQRLAQAADSLAQYNILSGLSVEEHHWAPPQHRPVVPPPREDNKLRSITQQPREYNVLTNEYKRDHARKTGEEQERTRRVAAERFWATHDMNIMTSKFYDPEKETHFQIVKQAVKAEQPLKQFKKLPSSYQQGEGFVYSIINFSVQNPELYARFEEKEQRSLDSKQAVWGHEAQIKERATGRALVEGTRTLNRISHKRYEDSTSHGYDIVTNKGYHDKDAAPLAPARTVPKPGHWQSLESSSNQFWQTRTMQTQHRLSLQNRPRPASEGKAGDATGALRADGGAASARGARPIVPALDMTRTRPALEMTANSSVRTGGFQ
ncbi:hypothetical protein T492DRAFT_988232 [Pavlovales sp. CCMP2436]|nr:hypothetical protein T492DRAFT_988232 [Pavlovales sp. CCMP2436]|mmetsp:Transcript_12964/g.32906  ORF Transcript_12964/g.32906 Transcript_12964/m.32906 type:complete len:452 (-) Transcript_12964:122-1477(-)